MMDFQAIISQAFADYGSALTLTVGGSSRTVTALLVPMDSTTINTYYDGNEAVGLVRPAAVVYTAGSEAHPPAPGDVFTDTDFGNPARLSSIFTVQKVQAFRIAGVVVLNLALCD